jgi:hypothetical protein
MASRISVGAGAGTARFWRDLSLLALILVLSALLGLRAVGGLTRSRWAMGSIWLATVIPLAVFAFQPDRGWRATADDPQPGQTPSTSAGAAPAQALDQEGKSNGDVVDLASMKERKARGEEAPRGTKIERQPAADVDTVAGAIVAGTEEKLPAQETWRTEPPRQDAGPLEQPAQPVQDARKQPEPDATKKTNPIAGAPAGPAADGPAAKDNTRSTAGLRSAKPEATPFRGRETGWRKSMRSGRHGSVVWSYLTHATGVARMGPVSVYLDH